MDGLLNGPWERLSVLFSIYFFPFLTGLIASISAYITIKLVFRPEYIKKKIAAAVGSYAEKNISLGSFIHSQLEKTYMNNVISDRIDRGLDQLIESFKQQIPMSAMFLSGSLSYKLKSKAREEILKMMPETQQSIIDHLEKSIDIRALMLEHIEGIETQEFKKYLFGEYHQRVWLLSGLCGLIGLMLGLIPMFWLIYFG